MAVHIGNVIHKLVKDKGLKAEFVANFVNVSESTLFKIYKRETVDIDKLIKFSELFDTNLFLNYFDEEPIKSMFGEQVYILQNQISHLESELSSKNEKLNDLIDIIEAQKKVISLQEDNISGGKPKRK